MEGRANELDGSVAFVSKLGRMESVTVVALVAASFATEENVMLVLGCVNSSTSSTIVELLSVAPTRDVLKFRGAA